MLKKPRNLSWMLAYALDMTPFHKVGPGCERVSTAPYISQARSVIASCCSRVLVDSYRKECSLVREPREAKSVRSFERGRRAAVFGVSRCVFRR
jgi:hypothetical protein